MNLYDFDNTIFSGDSSNRFFWYSFLRHPLLVIVAIFKACFECLKYLFGKSNFGQIKAALFSFVKYISNLEEYINKYVLLNMHRIKKFYLEQKKENDVIISASFDFIIKPFCEKLDIKNVIATEYDTKEGKIIGKNCKGNEKVKRFYELFTKETIINEAYSDSLSDIPMLKLAKNSYLVKKEKIRKYN